jgi:hypothetical protein
MTGISVSEGTFGPETQQTNTQGRRSCANKVRDWSHAVTSQGMPRLARKCQKVEEGKEAVFFQRLQRDKGPADMLTSDF